MEGLNDQLMASVRQLVLDNLPYDRRDRNIVQTLSAMTPSDLLILWLNWTRRMLPATPRHVLQSKEFAANPIVQQHRPDIDALIEDIQSGADLTKYLSRAVKHGYTHTDQIKPHRRQHLDLMLSAWGVHHLHFSQDVEPDNFVKRSGAIIFAVFRPDQAFLIDVMSHQDWAREHVIRVMVDNWPHEDLAFEIKSVEGLSRSVDDQERQKLRNGLVNTPLEINNKVYMPTVGMTTSGVSVDTVRQADRIMERIEAFARLYETDPDQIIAQARSQHTPWPEEPAFVVEFRPEAYGITEMGTQTFLKLGP